MNLASGLKTWSINPDTSCALKTLLSFAAAQRTVALLLFVFHDRISELREALLGMDMMKHASVVLVKQDFKSWHVICICM